MTNPPNKFAIASFAASEMAKPPIPNPATKPLTLKPNSCATTLIAIMTMTTLNILDKKGINRASISKLYLSLSLSKIRELEARQII